uniref:S8 family serine peptidase n=1 Tax=Saccharomonospora saliphila TaxID=369829 RepID=UPI00066236E9
MRKCGSAAVLGAALVLAGQQPGAAEPTSSRFLCPADAGQATRYLVLSEEETPTRSVTREIEAACGTVATHYARIGVTVAVSRNPEFADTLGTARVFATHGPGTRPGGHGSSAPPSGHAPSTPAPPTPRPTSEQPDHPANPDTDLRDRQWNLRAIGAASARRDGEGAPGVVVGVLDSGIDATHPDLASAVAPELSVGCTDGTPRRSPRDWAPSGSAHGTHVAGIVAAADDGRGITGVAAGARLASVKVVDDHGHVTPDAAVCGLMWAAEHGFAVANSSFVVTPWARACTGADDGRGVAREAVVRAVRHAHERGTLTVAAASNASAELTPHGLTGAG